MPRRSRRHPTELELAILKALWQQAPQTVEGVRMALASAGRELTYSSVITVLNIMVRKKYLTRKKVGRAFEFTPRIAEQSVHRNMLSDLVHRVFDGSVATVMLELLSSEEVDSDELREIRKLIDQKTREQKS
jgi:predicted transcriptional regulator